MKVQEKTNEQATAGNHTRVNRQSI